MPLQFDYRHLPPPLQQAQHPAVADPSRQARHQRRVRDRVEVLRQIGVHPFSSPVILPTTARTHGGGAGLSLAEVATPVNVSPAPNA